MPPIAQALVKYIEKVCVENADQLLKPEFKKLKRMGDHPLFYLCYPASEALHYLLKEHAPHIKHKAAQKKIFWRGNSIGHWIVVLDSGEIIDITAPQFQGEIELDYNSFKGRAFYHRQSNAAREIIRLVNNWTNLLPK